MSVVPFGRLEKKATDLAGGKGAALSDMVAAGFPVPEGYVVCADAFRELIRDRDILPQILYLIEKTDFDNAPELDHASKQIKQLITEAGLPDGLKQEITGHYRLACGGDGNLPVAVRSSSTAEDLEEASFAGQQETFLYVLGEDDLAEKVVQCWASLYNSRAIFYRRQKGFNEEKVSMAVVVQRMVNSEKAGVMFTVNPINKDRDTAVIEAVWGLGEGAVSGLVTPDSYLVNKKTMAIDMEYIAIKDLMVVQSDGKRGVREKPVPPVMEGEKVLTDGEIRTLVRYGQRLEHYFGKPQDVEWAIEKDTVYLLQSRPVTTL